MNELNGTLGNLIGLKGIISVGAMYPVDEQKIIDVVEKYMAEHPFEETDPTVPEWAKQENKPTYTAGEVGAYTKSEVNEKFDEQTQYIVNELGLIDEQLDTKLNITTYESEIGEIQTGFSDFRKAVNDELAEVRTSLDTKQPVGDYATHPELNYVEEQIHRMARKDEIPTKVSELQNDIPLATKKQLDDAIAEIEVQPYDDTELREEIANKQDKGDYALRSELPTHLSDLLEDVSHQTVTEAQKQTWDNKSDFSGNYNDLTFKPEIPTQLSQLSPDSTHQTVTLNEKLLWNNKSDFSGDYADLQNKPNIPTKLSDLTGDATHRLVSDTEKANWNAKVDEATLSETEETLHQEIQSVNTNLTTEINKKATIESLNNVKSELSQDIDTVEGRVTQNTLDISQLQRDVEGLEGVKFIPLSPQQVNPDGTPNIENPQEYTFYLVPSGEEGQNLWIEWVWYNQKWERFGSASIDLTPYVLKSELSTVATTGSYSDLSNTPDIPKALSDLTEDTTHRTVTDAEKNDWNGLKESKAEKSTVTALETKLNADVTRIEGKADKNTSDISDINTNTEKAIKVNVAGNMTPKDVSELTDGLYYFVNPVYNMSGSYSISGLTSINQDYVNNFDHGLYFSDFSGTSFSTCGSIDGFGNIEAIPVIEELEKEIQELQTFKFPNATIIGEPTINHGQISGFTRNDYLQFPFLVDFGMRPFEINMAFTTGSDVTNQQNIIDSDFGLAFAVKNSKFLIAISTNGTSWNVGAKEGTYTVEDNTPYFVRISWNRMLYKVEYSLDGTSYTTDITVTATQPPYPKHIAIGVGDLSTANPKPFYGTVNLNKSNVYIQGELIWQGMDDVGIATRAAIDLSNIDSSGEQVIADIANQEIDKVKDNYELKSNKVTTLTDSDTQYPTAKAVKDSLPVIANSSTAGLVKPNADEFTVGQDGTMSFNLDLNNTVPIIGTGGTWERYDFATKQYVDTGKPSRGIQGDKGDKPVKGVDYYTETDKQEIVNDVLSALPQLDEVNY